MIRRHLVAIVALATVAACGKKGEPEPPGGRKMPERTYPKPDPVPWQAPPQQQKK